MIIDMRFRPPTPTFAKSFSVSVSMEECVRDMEEAGVTGVIMGRQAGGTRGVVPNDEIAEACRRYPGRFIPFAGVDISSIDPRAALKEVDRCIQQLGFKGINVEPGISARPQYMDDPALYPIYYRCQELGVPVSISVSGDIAPDISYSNPAGLHRVAKSFPDLKIIASHACWPWAHQLIGVAYIARNVYVSPDFQIFNRRPGTMDYVNAVNGGNLAGRLLYGSAYPAGLAPAGVNLHGKPKDQVASWRQLPFKDIDAVLGGNAAGLLKLEGA